MDFVAIAACIVGGIALFALVCAWNIKVQKANAAKLARLSPEARQQARRDQRPRADAGWEVGVL